ncbi:fimbrial protein [Pseudomonas japonica]|uniref:Pilin (Type 1 fimbria component protein) n=1 Tax=Pseudomonas japonica TaxID=256466 RepID=A0A239GT00_9PSED|nr:fimbrial protein [Pseudomonas japonica]SNS71918.1 Pilin (type 1 fimbria component protein) [Pseudomonas japonica]
MIPATRYLLALAGLWFSAQTLAEEGCMWDDFRPHGPSTYSSKLGTRYVPRDAPVGTAIIAQERRGEGHGAQTPILLCHRWHSTEILRFDMMNHGPMFDGELPPLNGEILTGKVMNTSIPGVGVHLRVGFPFTGGVANEFKPVGEPVVPFTGLIDHNTGLYVLFARFEITLSLIKTGPIPPGIHHFDNRPLLVGTASMVGRVFDWHLEGQIIQSQCSLPSNPVSADPVQLGSWERTHFTAPDVTTTAVPFHITLSDCQDNPENNVATAHIRLDGVQGSTAVDAERGVFSLSSDSSAAGLGIQMLMADGITPVPLGRDVPLKVIAPSGDTVLPFSARYYQTGTAPQVRPGSAKGALSFTVSYQ